jgi:hypothetical protein
MLAHIVCNKQGKYIRYSWASASIPNMGAKQYNPGMGPLDIKLSVPTYIMKKDSHHLSLTPQLISCMPSILWLHYQAHSQKATCPQMHHNQSI